MDDTTTAITIPDVAVAVVGDDAVADVESGDAATDITIKTAHHVLVHDKKLVRAVSRIIVSAIYFAFFTNMLFTHIPTARMYEQAYAVNSILATTGGDAVTPGSPIKFYNIGQLGDVFDWLTNSFVPAVFVTQDQNGVDLPPEYRGRIGLFNKALGGVLVQVQSKSEVECDGGGSLLKLYPVCHEFVGNDDEYNIYFFMYGNATAALEELDELKTANWIDSSTASVTISVLTYNGELEGYVVTDLILEFHTGGYITPSARTRSMISIPYGKQSSFASDVLVWIWWGLTMMWAISCVWKWRTKEKRPSRYRMITRTFDLFAVNAATCVFYSIWANIVALLDDGYFQDSLWRLADPAQLDIEGTGDDIDALFTVIISLMEIADRTTALRVIGAAIIALIGLQIMYRFRFHPQLNILTRTVASALKQFASFFVVFIVIFLTFTVIGCMIFGDRAKEFSSLDNSMASCINMLFGVFDFESIKELQFSVAFYWIYMIVVSLVLMNMMLAIVLNAYEQVSSESYKKAVNLELASRIVSVCWDEILERLYAHNSAVVNGKIRSRLLERELNQRRESNPDTILSLSLLKSWFPNTDIKYKDTLVHLKKGVLIRNSLEAEKNSSKKDPTHKR